ncbi:MAG: ABC transporter ATP-binding protein [Kiritimatiellia bacterium]|nr:ABC transporter ATP-binding protein [Kiritimatiellia bacterium]
MNELLSIGNLRIRFGPDSAPVYPVDGLSLKVGEGDRVALVGESGCGKSLTALSVARLLPEAGRIAEGRILWRGRDVTAMGEAEVRGLRGREIGYVFQDPAASLNPVLQIRAQVREALRWQGRAGGVAAAVEEWLRRVRIPDPSRVARAWPHELSGGMQQRVMLAMAMASRPSLLIADEPTTALDVTVQAQIFDLLADLQAATGMALLLITHDLSLIPEVADRMAVMYAGRVVEEGPVGRVLAAPAHPYTRALLAAAPGWAVPGTRPVGIAGQIPNASAWPTGCRFHPRCPVAVSACRDVPPLLQPIEPGWSVACPLAHKAKGQASLD